MRSNFIICFHSENTNLRVDSNFNFFFLQALTEVGLKSCSFSAFHCDQVAIPFCYLSFQFYFKGTKKNILIQLHCQKMILRSILFLIEIIASITACPRTDVFKVRVFSVIEPWSVSVLSQKN